MIAPISKAPKTVTGKSQLLKADRRKKVKQKASLS